MDKRFAQCLPGLQSATIKSLIDNKFGDVTVDKAAGDSKVVRTSCAKATISAGKTYKCSFDAIVGPTDATGHVNVVTGKIEDNEKNSIERSGNAKVVLQ